MGTDFYCSPEQLKSLKKTDHRTDIYSFGKMLYETFANERPDILEIGKLPPEIRYIVRKCTNESPAERFSSVEELRTKFNNAMELLLEGVDDDLQSIIKSIDESETHVTKYYPQLAEALSKTEDEEELHEAVIMIKGEVYGGLFNNYPDLVRDTVRNFTEYIDSQYWPFSYTDTLGDKYKDIFVNVIDNDLRLNLLYYTLRLSVQHNRWYVMGVFVDMLYIISEDEDLAHEVYHELSHKEFELGRVEANVNIDKTRLHKVHKKFFN